MAVDIDLRGDKALLRKLKKLDRRGVKAVTKAAVGQAVTPWSKATKRRAKKHGMVVRKAIGKRTKIAQNGDIAGVVGTRTKFFQKHNLPSNWGHLLEFGTVDQPPEPFIRPGFLEARQQVMVGFRDIYFDKIMKRLKRP